MAIWYIDNNYPGVVYEVPENLAEKFEEYARENGAYLAVRKDHVLFEDEELRKVIAIYMTPEKWGLDIEREV